MTNAIGYTRLSQESDTSIQRQKAHIRAYARDSGLDLEEPIYDDGERSSGFDADREQYQLVRDRVREGDVDAIVVNDKRRVARDFDETMRLILDCRENDVELHTHHDGRLDLSDPMHAAIEVLQAASDYEAKTKEIERAREAVQERIDEGYHHGRPPFGMQLDDEGQYLEPDPDEFQEALEVLERREQGESYHEIADAVGISSATAQAVVERRDQYLTHAEESLN